MKVTAVGLHGYGGPDVLRLVEIDVPEPARGQVRIRVCATPVTPADVWLRQGGIDALMAGASRPFVPGLELSGVVESAGPGARFAPGDEVVAVTTFVGTGRGCQSELVVIDDADVAARPNTVTHAEASTVPMSGLTAELCLDTLEVGAGARIAVTGPDGTVGRFVRQLGADRGQEMIPVPRPGPDDRWSPADKVRQLVPDGVDGLVDCAGIGADVVSCVRPGGRLVVLRPASDATRAAAAEAGVGIELVSVRRRQGDPARLARLMAMVDRRVLRPRVAEVSPVSDVVALHRRFERGGLDGRLVMEWGAQRP